MTKPTNSKSEPQSSEFSVRHVAHLARLSIADVDAERFSEQLASVLQYMEQLNELDTTDVPPTAHPLAVRNVFREDEIQPSWDAKRALSNAPGQQDDCFRVPKVLDQESA